MENLTLKQKIAIYDEIEKISYDNLMENYYQENKDSPTLKEEMVRLAQDFFRINENEIIEFLDSKKVFEIKIVGGGSREKIIEALKLITKHIEKEYDSDEIDGGEYNDCVLRVEKFTEQ